MNRCFSRAPGRAVLLALGLAAAAAAPAQPSDLQPPAFTGTPNDHRARAFAPNAERGRIVFEAPPDVLLNGQPQRLAPGGRIFTPRRMLTTPAKLTGVRAEVMYTLDPTGRLQDIWLLGDNELNALSPAQKREMLTGVPRAQRPRKDRLRQVPFDELPRYGEQNTGGSASAFGPDSTYRN